MKTKVFVTTLVLLALFAVTAMAALGPQMDQNIVQGANQVIKGPMVNNSTINQS